MKILNPFFGLLILLNLGVGKAVAVEAPEPGPEDGGLRLRLLVSPRADAGQEGYQVKLDVLNVSERPMQGGWQHDWSSCRR